MITICEDQGEVRRLQSLVNRKSEECHLAAQAGTMLLEENELLKSKLEELESTKKHQVNYDENKRMPKKGYRTVTADPSLVTTQFDSNLAAEVQQYLLKQSRTLMSELSSEKEERQLLEYKYAELETSIAKLQTEKNKIELKTGIDYFNQGRQGEKVWDLEISMKSMQTALQESQDDYLKSQNDNQRKALRLGILENKLQISGKKEMDWKSMQLDFEKRTKALKMQIDVNANKLCNTKVSAMDRCTQTIDLPKAGDEFPAHLRETIMTLQEEKSELQILLAGAQERYEIAVEESLSMTFPSLDVANLTLAYETASAEKSMTEESFTQTTTIILASVLSQTNNEFVNNTQNDMDLAEISEIYPEDMFFQDLDSEIGHIDTVLRRKLNTSILTGNSITSTPVDRLKCLTHMMMGSWFQKFNRHDKNAHLRFFWINPYSRLLMWSEKPPQEDSVKFKQCLINSVSWAKRSTKVNPNYLPRFEDSILISGGSRSVRVIPLNWYDHEMWVNGICTLLKRNDDGDTGQEANHAAHQSFLSNNDFEMNNDDMSDDSVVIQEVLGTPGRHQRINTVAYRDDITPNPMRHTQKEHFSPASRRSLTLTKSPSTNKVSRMKSLFGKRDQNPTLKSRLISEQFLESP